MASELGFDDATTVRLYAVRVQGEEARTRTVSEGSFPQTWLPGPARLSGDRWTKDTLVVTFPITQANWSFLSRKPYLIVYSRDTMTETTLLNSVEARQIDWTAAYRAVEAAANHAQHLVLRMNVAVVDAAGNLAAFLRMPGAPLHSIDIAIDKAYTAASFGLPTSCWGDALLSHSPAVRQGIVLRPRFVAFGGGLPIVEGSYRIGGIGVSGGTEEQDEQCAQAGLAVLGLSQS